MRAPVNPLHLLKHLAVAQHQAFHNAPCERCRSRKRCLPVLDKKGIDRCRHVLRGQKAWVVWINQGGKWPDCDHVGEQGTIIGGMAVALPIALAFLQKPESHHVLEKASGTEDPTLIRTIGGEGRLGHDRLPEFHPDQ